MSVRLDQGEKLERRVGLEQLRAARIGGRGEAQSQRFAARYPVSVWPQSC